MAGSPEKEALRGVLLEKRDGISSDFMGIAGAKIFKKLRRMSEFRDARNMACYYPTGSEVPTQDILLEALSCGKRVCLPKVAGDDLEFRQISALESLEKGAFEIPEPRDGCAACADLDIIIVPAVGLSRNGARLGYGHGYYDRFLSRNRIFSIALSYSKQVVKSIPTGAGDVPVDWIVTEDESFGTS